MPVLLIPGIKDSLCLDSIPNHPCGQPLLAPPFHWLPSGLGFFLHLSRTPQADVAGVSASKALMGKNLVCCRREGCDARKASGSRWCDPTWTLSRFSKCFSLVCGLCVCVWWSNGLFIDFIFRCGNWSQKIRRWHPPHANRPVNCHGQSWKRNPSFHWCFLMCFLHLCSAVHLLKVSFEFYNHL